MSRRKTDFSKPRTLEEGSFASDADNIAHLSECPGCDVCNYLIEFYESCDNCGEWGHMDATLGVVVDGVATALCTDCLDKYEDDPKSVFILGCCRDGLGTRGGRKA